MHPSDDARSDENLRTSLIQISNTVRTRSRNGFQFQTTEDQRVFLKLKKLQRCFYFPRRCPRSKNYSVKRKRQYSPRGNADINATAIAQAKPIPDPNSRANTNNKTRQAQHHSLPAEIQIPAETLAYIPTLMLTQTQPPALHANTETNVNTNCDTRPAANADRNARDMPRPV